MEKHNILAPERIPDLSPLWCFLTYSSMFEEVRLEKSCTRQECVSKQRHWLIIVLENRFSSGSNLVQEVIRPARRSCTRLISQTMEASRSSGRTELIMKYVATGPAPIIHSNMDSTLFLYCYMTRTLVYALLLQLNMHALPPHATWHHRTCQM